MISIAQNRLTLALTLGVPCAAAFWILGAGTNALPSTFVFVALIIGAMGVVGLNAWNNSQATGSMAQVIHETDISPVTAEDGATKSSHEQQHSRR